MPNIIVIPIDGREITIQCGDNVFIIRPVQSGSQNDPASGGVQGGTSSGQSRSGPDIPSVFDHFRDLSPRTLARITYAAAESESDIQEILKNYTQHSMRSRYETDESEDNLVIHYRSSAIDTRELLGCFADIGSIPITIYVG